MRRVTPRLVRRKIVFNGRIFRIERDRVTLPDGRPATMDVVRHRGSVVLVPQPRPGHVILIRQYRYAISRWIWELPAGSLEPGEAPARAARRECAEEIGLVPRRLRRLGVFYPTPGFCDERMIFFRCSDLARPARPVAGDEDEQIEPRTMSIASAWRLVARGKIIDMKTVLGLVLIESVRP
ncbi:MAG TPA: NUDIX hydrolase [Vicinamibacterales bacterium]|nr:NUDIX hydrolase [Vicinamibacterales bacterium]